MENEPDNYEDMPHEDLVALIEHLEEENQSLMEELRDAQKEARKKKGGKGIDGDTQRQVDSLRDKLDDVTADRDRIREEAASYKAKFQNSEDQRKSLEDQLRRALDEKDLLDKEFQDRKDSIEKDKRKNEERQRQEKEERSEKSNLLQELITLRNEKEDIDARCDELMGKETEMNDLIVQLNAEKDYFETKYIEMTSTHQDLHSQIHELNEALQKETDEQIRLNDMYSELRTEMDTFKKAQEIESSKLKEQLDKEQKENKSLSSQIDVLKDSTEMGMLQKKIDAIQEERDRAADDAEHLATELQDMEVQLAAIEKKCQEYDQRFDDQVYERVAKEREQNKIYMARLESQANALKDEKERNNQLEIEKDKLVREKEELEGWNKIYERGHHVQELAKHQKKVKEDNRKLGIAMEQMSRKLSETMDTCTNYQSAFAKLKKECGKPPDFMYPEYELQEEVKSDNAKLNMQIKELESQIDSLETECIRLRKTLKNQIGFVGEKGFQHYGMNADQIIKVNEFAMNLRDGKFDKDGNVELPVDDKSRELLRENRKLREEIEELQGKIDAQHYESNKERYHGGSMKGQEKESQPYSDSSAAMRAQESEIFGLREDLAKLLKENVEIKTALAGHHDNVAALIKQHLGNADNHAEVLHATHSENTERLLKELQALRASGIMPFVPTSQETAHRLGTPRAATPKAPTTGSRPPTRGDASSEQWTPAIGGIEKSDSDPRVGLMTSASVHTTFHPATPHGKNLLNKTLANLNLPPEEWAEEVKELNAQLIECLEQLYEREAELNEQRETIASLEDNLVVVKQQMSAVYFDYKQKSDAWEDREKQIKDDNKNLIHKCEDLELKLKRTSELIKATEEDEESITNRLKEMSRKLLIYEVNETVLSRRYTSLEEQMKMEKTARENVQVDMAEMETTLKKRILYLEQYKLAVGSKLGRLQGKLDMSIPIEDFQALEVELSNLREDHLAALTRETEAKISTLRAQEKSRELRALRHEFDEMRLKLSKAEATSENLALQLVHQKEATNKALLAANSSPELSNIVSEMARFRGETSRLEIELLQANKKSELLSIQVKDTLTEIDECEAKYMGLKQSEEQLIAKEAEARNELVALQLKFNGGLERNDAEELKNTVDKLSKDYEEAKRDVDRFKELAEIAANQARMVDNIKGTRDAEFKALQEHCAHLESRGDDDILIGQLHRKLVQNKLSYKAFIRKYHILRTNMRQREIAQRVLETQLDERDAMVQTYQETHRAEVGALKRAIRAITNQNEEDKMVSEDLFEHMSLKGLSKDQEINMRLKMRQTLSFIAGAIHSRPGKKADSKLLTNGQRLSHLSEKVSTLAELAEESLKTTWDFEERNKKLAGDLQDAHMEKDILAQKQQDLEAIIEGEGRSKQQLLAARLVSLSEDVRVNKLVTLQQRRQINVLRQEKKHLQSLLSSMENDVENLEEGKIIAETKGLLAENDAAISDGLNDSAVENVAHIKEDFPTMNEDMFVKPSTLKPVLKIQTTDLEEAFAEDEKKDPAALLAKLEDMAKELSVHRKDVGMYKLENDQLNGKMMEMQRTLDEMDEQILFYEKVLEDNDLPHMRYKGEQNREPKTPSREKGSALAKQEAQRIQEAAQATVHSLKSLIEEKNRTIDKYRRKVEELLTHSHQKSYIDEKAEDLLRKLDAEEDKIRSPTQVPMGADEKSYRRLLDQVEAADEIISDKDKTISQLEQNLMSQGNQRERAEIRCGAALKEMENMKTDMITLVQQLKESEERNTELVKGQTSSIVNSNPHDKRNKAKDEKLKKYREIIIKLKEEFIKSEEQNASDLAKLEEQNKGSANGSSQVNKQELSELQSQVIALRDGLKQAKEDLEAARKNREKLSKARSAAQEEVDRLETQVGRAEAQASAAQEALARCRRELEDSKRKEVKLRDKLKDLLANEKGAAKDKTSTESQETIARLENELSVVKAQNVALRRESEELSYRKRQEREDAADELLNPKSKEEVKEPAKPSEEKKSGMTGKGYILGSTMTDDSNPDEMRKQLKAKWEQEKKLERRVKQLEQRLKERMDENDELQSQIKKARDGESRANNAYEEVRKKLNAAKQPNKGAGGQGITLTGNDAEDLENSRAKVFELEEALQEVRRKAEVEQAGELSILRHQVVSSQSRIDELESSLREEQRRRKKLERGEDDGENKLRESEDRFMREERLRDDLDAARRTRLDLEAALLERDSRAMENRFDLEARTAETERLRRRLREVEAAAKSNIPDTGRSGSKRTAWGDETSRTGGASTKKEKELEGVIEAMKRVIDKLKSENDRMKKTGGPEERKTNEAIKSAGAAKKQAEALQEEVTQLKSKLKQSEKNMQELTTKQTAMVGLRKAIKSKDDELAGLRSVVADLETKNQETARSLQVAENKIIDLERSKPPSGGGGIVKEDREMRERLTQQTVDLQVLRSELEMSRRENHALKKMGTSGGASEEELNNLRKMNRDLAEENGSLKKELAAFDLEFFEEIENLKFEHAQAIRKLQRLEGRDTSQR